MNFALILFVLVVVTGIAWVLDKLIFLPGRKRSAETAVAEYDRQQARIEARFADENADATRAKLRSQNLRQPWWLEYTASFFPVILAVFVVRSFVVEPYKIPSGSMIPTLLVGDFILVNKFEYGLRMPVTNERLTQGSPLKRGDVVVFEYPLDTSTDYIKRVIGLPGDTVAYIDKKLTINGQPVPETTIGDYYDDERQSYVKELTQTLDGTRTNNILNDPNSPPFVPLDQVAQYEYRDNCQYNEHGVICKVPPGHYFMMGDNRDDSADSRYWGFVPDKDVIGRAFFVWMNFSSLKRIGPFH